jgi:hypothetical protein
VDLSQGLVLHLKFDGDYADYSGRGNNSANVGATTFVPGKIGAQALHYSSSTASKNYVTLGAPADLAFSSNVNFSVAYWIKLPAGDVQPSGGLPIFGNAIYSLYTPGYVFAPSYATGAWGESINDGRGGTVVSLGAANSINDGNWHQLVHTLDRKGLAITYLDGYQVDAQPLARVGDLDQGATTIGQNPTAVFTQSDEADVDDLSVWRRVLSPLEVGAAFTAGNIYGASVVSAPVRISIKPVGGQVQVTWSGGILQAGDHADGPYNDVAGAVAPYLVSPSLGEKFFRVRQ